MARTYTVGYSCKCGSAFQIDARSHRRTWQMLSRSFTQMHEHCITEVSNDDIEEPGGDVYAQAERAGQHSQHELQIGFQRGDLSW